MPIVLPERACRSPTCKLSLATDIDPAFISAETVLHFQVIQPAIGAPPGMEEEELEVREQWQEISQLSVVPIVLIPTKTVFCALNETKLKSR